MVKSEKLETATIGKDAKEMLKALKELNTICDDLVRELRSEILSKYMP